MAICTKCGAVGAEDDLKKHKCEGVPTGKIKKVKYDIEEVKQ